LLWLSLMDFFLTSAFPFQSHNCHHGGEADTATVFDQFSLQLIE
jgi:hypothetical protein